MFFDVYIVLNLLVILAFAAILGVRALRWWQEGHALVDHFVQRDLAARLHRFLDVFDADVHSE
jgi:hypothetical protein